jgi:glycosyltransferase involved in cell wall biosynthesis
VNLAYVYEFQADDINVQSGHPFFILDQLMKRANVQQIFPLTRFSKYAFTHKLLLNKLLGRSYHPDREPLLLKSFTTQIEHQLTLAGKVDCLFSPSSCAMTYLEVDLPKVFCADQTFAKSIDAYSEYTNCSPDYLKRGHEQEARALTNCTAAIYPSEWAARSAIEDYNTDPAKVYVLPFGANVEPPPSKTIDTNLDCKVFEPFRILFIGRDWKRKGGDTVLKACAIAAKRGVPIKLDLVGLDIIPEALPDYATNHGLLLKSNSIQRAKLEGLLMQTHLVFVPSRAEAFGMTFCEAAAYGVPSLSSNVGGIPTIVHENLTGFSLPVESEPEAYAQRIEACFADRRRYVALGRSARRYYDQTLTWDVYGEKLLTILQKLIGTRREGMAVTPSAAR